MSKRRRKARSINQLVGNRGSERGLSRNDAFTAYVMDRLLYRIGRSKHAKEFYLKGGILVANLVGSPHRFTRDIDLLRRHGRPVDRGEEPPPDGENRAPATSVKTTA